MDRSDSDLPGRVDSAPGGMRPASQVCEAVDVGSSDGVAETIPANGNMVVRLADGSDADYRAGVYLAREAHQNTIFRDIPFSEAKARAIFDKAMANPGRFGLIYAVPGGGEPLAEDGLYGFASVHAGEYFLGSGTLIATVQTLNISRNLSGKMLGGKVALRLTQAIRQWAKERRCSHILVHVTNGMSAAESDQFFRRCGLKTVGGNYVEAL
ncbi:hypothetical protein [Roseibium album]|uniref:hypothetical protein n=1 Tax=Roseibium album TaxID=311410 RepID=UPI002490700E|nr:hypothetical protein [Roseibium album]